MKTCFKCGVEKPRTEFYRHPAMGDGLLGKCKDCTRADVSTNWHKHADVLRQTDRLRQKIRKQANGKVAKAIRAGKLVKPITCYYCNAEARLAAHHWDYYRPLDVTWLCSRCHAIADQARKDAETRLLAAESA